MDDIVFMLKTYRGDVGYYHRLIDSFCEHNKDDIKLFVVVPHEDTNLFSIGKKNISIISEEDVPVELSIKGVGTFSPGYINQEIIKLSFWKLNICKNYFCIDSECFFIKDFFKSDFMWDDETPYTVFYDDNELLKDPVYYDRYGRGRKTWNKVIMDSLGVQRKKMFSCHGLGIISSSVMQNFEDFFLKPNSYTYKDIIHAAPLEFTWYNYWLQKERVIDIYAIPPLVMTYHSKEQFLMDKLRGITFEDIKRNYIAVLINSNTGVLTSEDSDTSFDKFKMRICRKLMGCEEI